MGAALAKLSDPKEDEYVIPARDMDGIQRRLAERDTQLVDRAAQFAAVAAATTQQLATLKGSVATFVDKVTAAETARAAATAELGRSCAVWRERREIAEAAKRTVLDVHRAVARWEEAGGPAREAEELAKAPGAQPEFGRAAAVAFAAAVEARRWEVAQWLRDHFGDAAVNLKGPMMESAIASRDPALVRELVARGHVDRGSADYAAEVLETALSFGDLDAAVFLAARGGLCREGVEPLLPRLRAAVVARRAAAAEMALMENELLEPAAAATVATATVATAPVAPAPLA
jgi:hypothetical protein